MPYETGRTTVRDVGIHMWRGGTGEKILFLHGAGGVGAWLPFFEALSGKYSVMVPEHPGFGRSDDPKWIRTVPDVAMFYLDVLEQEGAGGVHLIGNSLGGWIAAEIAIRDRSRIKSLTLISPAGIRIKGIPTGDVFIWSPEEQARNVFFDQDLAQRVLALPVSDEQADLNLKNRFAATKYGWQPRWFNPDLEKWLHRVKVPTQLVWGDTDLVIPTAYAELWRQRLPQAQLAVIAQCGHLPHIEKAAEVARIVGNFIAGAAS